MDGNSNSAISLNDSHNYFHLIGITILYYDYLLTFGQEVNYVWSKPTLIQAWPFFMNRYFSLLAEIAVNVGNFTPFKTVDDTLPPDVVIVRTYALWGRDKHIWVGIICVSLLLAGVAAWASLDQSSKISVSLGCHTASTREQTIRTAVVWECLFVFDCMIFALTVFKSYKVSSGRIETLSDLVILIARDGAIYFAVMATVHLGTVFTFIFWTPASDILYGALSTFASCISVTLISRLTLNLQEKAEHMRTPDGTDGSIEEFSAIQFEPTGGSSTGRQVPSRMLLSSQGNMEAIDEAVELREISSPSRDFVSVHRTVVPVPV